MSRPQSILAHLVPLVFLTAAAAHAETPTRRVSVFVTTAPLAAEAAPGGYGAVPAEDLAGSVKDIELAIVGAGIRGERKCLRLVDSAADAHLVVEVRSRRSTRIGIGLFSRHYGVLYAIKPGARVAAAQFAAMPGRRGRPAVSTSPSGSPEMVAEIVNNGSWKAVGALIASKVDDLAEHHAALLLEPVTEAP